MNKIVARCQDWSGGGIEHLVLREGFNQIVADAAPCCERARGYRFDRAYDGVCNRAQRLRDLED